MDKSRWLTGGRVHLKLTAVLRDRITTGVYPAGSRLPSENALSTEFKIARTTIRRALAALEAEELLVTIPSKGRLVSARPPVQSPYQYRLIAEELRVSIESGDLAEGTALPSETTLCKRYTASRNTVRHALGVLERESLIEPRQGRGWFVRRQESETS
ncbi:GntR family transcriptional regulator [Herbidospora cretacea]|uniref:GntR family transcriptional regulator n=1 Tax=Herbidospora cretacea TaxID=28444 RepID=UPI001FDF0E13|nr:GntR family transcriptional regulator [Herbidospora cretacea]